MKDTNVKSCPSSNNSVVSSGSGRGGLLNANVDLPALELHLAILKAQHPQRPKAGRLDKSCDGSFDSYGSWLKFSFGCQVDGGLDSTPAFCVEPIKSEAYLVTRANVCVLRTEFVTRRSAICKILVTLIWENSLYTLEALFTFPSPIACTDATQPALSPERPRIAHRRLEDPLL